MPYPSGGRTALSAAAFFLVLLTPGAQAEEIDPNDRIAPIDTVAIIGRKSDVADVPGSAHVIDNEELEVFIATDILRVLRTVPGVYVQIGRASCRGRV